MGKFLEIPHTTFRAIGNYWLLSEEKKKHYSPKTNVFTKVAVSCKCGLHAICRTPYTKSKSQETGHWETPLLNSLTPGP